MRTKQPDKVCCTCAARIVSISSDPMLSYACVAPVNEAEIGSFSFVDMATLRMLKDRVYIFKFDVVHISVGFVSIL